MSEERERPSQDGRSVNSARLAEGRLQTAEDFLNEQLRLEEDAREALPYSFDICTKPLGPLRQTVFACLTCNPPPSSPAQVYKPAGICYACSISCHGDHELAELFTKRNFECDCGTTRIGSNTPCSLRINVGTGLKGDVRGETAREENRYNHNFMNRFCACGEVYEPEKETGVMFQCLGLGGEGSCGEDWWHPECLMGIPRQKQEDKKENEEGDDDDDDETPLPEGFPKEDDFEGLVCYKCLEADPWLKRYAGTPGFLPPVFRRDVKDEVEKKEEKDTVGCKEKSQPAFEDTPVDSASKKRKLEEETGESSTVSSPKRVKEEEDRKDDVDVTTAASTQPTIEQASLHSLPSPIHEQLPTSVPSPPFTLFFKEDFRTRLCHCPTCFPHLAPYPQLLDEEEIYEPPESRPASPAPGSASRQQSAGQGSVHSGGSLYDRGEAALNTMDRVKALEGVMIYTHLRDKVKEFLRPYAERGEAVGAEDVREYFARLRGDAGGSASVQGQGEGTPGEGDDEPGEGGSRREQSGY